jgi:hypothetical protein
VHLLPAERSGRRIIDGERVCQAIAAITPPEAVAAHAKTFAVLGDPTRLTLLIAIKAAGPISVSDLATGRGPAPGPHRALDAPRGAVNDLR